MCAVGTTEPWSAAGLTLDVRALRELGAHPFVVVAAVSAQAADGVRALHAMPPSLVRAQFEALSGAPVDAIKIGALPTESVAREVAAGMPAGVPAVYDPALAASGGGALTSEDAFELAWAVIPVATLVTPNLEEAAALLGWPVAVDAYEMRETARELVTRGARAVLLKGGHLAGAPHDVLFDGQSVTEFEADRIAEDLRGTGCLLANAIAVAAARGAQLTAAVEFGRAYVRRKIATGIVVGGMRLAD